MKLITFIFDLVDIVGRTPTIYKIRLTPNETGVDIYALSGEDSKVGVFVLLGKTKEPIEGLNCVIGLHGLEHIAKIMRSPGFSRANATAEFKCEKHSDDHYYKYIEVKNSNDHSYKINYIQTENVDSEFKQAKLKRAVTYEVNAIPQENGLKSMKYWMKETIENGGKPAITPFTSGTQLKVIMSTSGFNDVEYPFSSSTDGHLQKKHSYSCQTIYDLCSLVNETKRTVIGFDSKGLCKISIETTYLQYDFLIPADA